MARDKNRALCTCKPSPTKKPLKKMGVRFPVKGNEFDLWVSALVVSRGFDIWTTYVATADLSAELNPLVSILGMGWSTLIMVSMVAVALLALAFHKALLVRDSVIPDPPAATFLEFFSDIYLGDRTARWRLLWSLPRGPRRWWFVMGTMGMVVVTVGGFAAGVSNLLFAADLHPLSHVALAAVALYTMILIASFTGYGLYLYRLHERHMQHGSAAVDHRQDDMEKESLS